MVSLAGFCIAHEAPGNLVYVQGGESSITNVSDGAYLITVKDIIPYFHITDGEKNSLIPIEQLANLTYPMNAALVLSGDENETTIMVQIANMSHSDGYTVLTLQVQPLPFYEGELLKSLHYNSQELDALVDSKFAWIGLRLEMTDLAPSNYFIHDPITHNCGHFKGSDPA